MADETDYRTPGQLLQHLLESRQWTQQTLAIVLDIDKSVINKIIAGKKAVDAKTALGLGEIFQIEPERFMELQKTYDLAQARLIARADPARAKRAHLFGDLPVAEMIKRGWLEAQAIRDVRRVESALAQFFGVDSPEEIEILPHAAKKTNVAGPVTPAQLAWLYRVRKIASEMLVSRYSIEGLRWAVDEMKPLLFAAEATRKVPKILSDCGVRYVIVESLPGAKIDGVCFWLNDFAPVIGMTLRFDRLDNFWFVLRHEVEHVLRRHGKGAAMLDAELEGDRAGDGPTVAEEERIANEAAADFCVPQNSLDRFIARKAPFFPERDILGFARTLHLHPGIVAGQLQRRTGRYDRFRQLLAKVRSHIAPTAVVDGWGDVVPTSI
jgi:HTH-type transcriptional regulator/antitoxin HigA